MPSAATRNGTPIPIAYAHNRIVPRPTASVRAAIVSAAASNGPTQGLQPAPNATPTMYGRATPVIAGSCGISRRSRAEHAARDTEERQPHDDDHHSADDAHDVLERRQRRPEEPGHGAQAREHRGETRDEDQRCGNRPRGIVGVAHLADDDPEVRGDERDDARREERRDTRAEQRDDLAITCDHAATRT